MNMQHDADYYNALRAEEKAEMRQVNEERNRILRMSNPQRKQAEWNRVFGHHELVDNDKEHVY